MVFERSIIPITNTTAVKGLAERVATLPPTFQSLNGIMLVRTKCRRHSVVDPVDEEAPRIQGSVRRVRVSRIFAAGLS